MACLLIEHFPFKFEVSKNPDLKNKDLIIYEVFGSRRVVLDTSPNMEQVPAGMPLKEASSRYDNAEIIAANLPIYHHEFDRILLGLCNISPLVESAELGCAYIGLDGLQSIHKTKTHLVNSLLQSIPSHLSPRLGMSHNKFTAYLAAKNAEPGSAYQVPVQLKNFLSSFPVEVLPVKLEIKTRLKSFGLDTIGKLADLPIGPVQAQFGIEGTRMWHLAHGLEHSYLTSLKHEIEVSESATSPVPTASSNVLLNMIKTLLDNLFVKADIQGRLVRTAILECRMVNKTFWQRRFTFKTPVGNSQKAYSIIKRQIQDLSLPGEVEEIRLVLKNPTSESGIQKTLFKDLIKEDQLSETISSLEINYGSNPIYQVRELEPWSRIPERRRALVSYKP